MKKIKLFNLLISFGSFPKFLDEIIENGKIRKSSYVCVSNVHMCVETYQDSSFGEIVNKSDITTPDGLPLVKAIKWLYGIEQERISGPDLMPELLEAAEKENLKVYLYGSVDEVLDKLDDYCLNNFPHLSLAGKYSPPFRTATEEEIQADIDRINNSEANIVFVALGCPKQERWMASMKGKINAVMIGVGGAFPMLVGIEKRAPIWMQKYMLEWLYRLIQDPKRLFKRYFITNSIFIYLVVKEKIKLSITPTFKKAELAKRILQ